MHRFGVKKILAGADVSERRLHRGHWPGFALLFDLIFLVDAGLTPLEALQAATINPALFMEATDSLGVIAPGKVADLVVLDANPLVDIRHIMQTRGVMANGRYFDRAALDSIDPVGAERAKSYAQQTCIISRVEPVEESLMEFVAGEWCGRGFPGKRVVRPR